MQRRLRWVELFLKINNYRVVCLRCGISRPTLRKWVRQFQENGMDGLRALSKRPKSSPTAKVADKHRDWIRELRKRGLGSRRIQNELKRFYNFEISRATIDKTLRAIEAKPLLRRSRNRKHSTRYAKLIPGERIQMDTCKIAPGVYQYTAIDDCTRIRVLAIYPAQIGRQSRCSSWSVQSKNFPFQFRRSRQIVAGSSSPIRSRKSSWSMPSSSDLSSPPRRI